MTNGLQNFTFIRRIIFNTSSAFKKMLVGGRPFVAPVGELHEF